MWCSFIDPPLTPYYSCLPVQPHIYIFCLFTGNLVTVCPAIIGKQDLQAIEKYQTLDMNNYGGPQVPNPA